MPVWTPRSLAWRLVANTFVSGAAPARIATLFSRRSGSRRTTACAGKSGTNRHAKANVRPLNLVEERETNRAYYCFMAWAAASKRNPRVLAGVGDPVNVPVISQHLPAVAPIVIFRP